MKALFSAMAVWLLVDGATAQAPARDAAAPAPAVGIERVFPHLRFRRPVFLTHAGDGSGRLFVVEQQGVIRVFSPDPEVREAPVFLDIRDRVSRRGNEEGLLGLAFHPRFEENGHFFVHYSSSVNDQHGIVARFRVDPKRPDRADPESERPILVQPQPYRNHNGGMIAFGPDGYLYVSLGDGGFANDPQNNAQNLSNWLGTILRIDVDRPGEERPYSIPPDNPFVGRSPEVREEIWAYGLRNVWRFSFDRETGELFAGDVGQDRFEEIDRIVAGGNYGWRGYEASKRFVRRTRIPAGEHVEPIAEYGRSEGISVTGGYVYRGARHPALRGLYFYGDYASGNLWALERTGGGYRSTLVRRTGRSIASFGEDESGEVYLLSFDGGLYRIVPTAEPDRSLADWPERLSQTGLFASLPEHRPAEHLIPYEINVGFWSDGARKERFLVLPDGGRLGYRASGSFELPVGSTLVKSFFKSDRGRERPLETRLIRRTPDGYEAATYAWDLDRREARLVPTGLQSELLARDGITVWHAPSSSECRMCHTDAAGFVLGLTAAQLNRPAPRSERNQLAAWTEAGILEGGPAGFASVARHPGEAGEVGARARAWLDVNCAMCHRPDGTGNAAIDLRFDTPLAESGMIDGPVERGDLGIGDPRIVAPGEPDRSVLLERIRTLGPGRMPNVATNVVDEEGAELIREWILGLPVTR